MNVWHTQEVDEPTKPEPRAVWDQVPGEPPEAWEAFRAYLRYPTPNVSGFAVETGRSRSTTGALASRWRWKARRAAFEHVVSQEHVRGALDAARALGAEHGRLLAEARDWALDSILDAKARGEKLSKSEALAYLRNVIELDRLIAGEATARVVVDLSKASDEDLDAAEKALDKVLTTH